MKKVFSGTDIKSEQWNRLADPGQVQEVLRASRQQPQLVYKHSHTCGICHVAKKRIEESFYEISKQVNINFINVKNSRSISNAFAEKLGVRHESPQVLIINQGECVWHKSHWGIKADGILEALNETEE